MSFGMDFTGVSTVTTQGTSNEFGDIEKLCAKAIQDVPLSFHEGRTYGDYLRRLERFARLRTGLRLHTLDQLSGLLDDSEFLPLLSPALLPAQLRPLSSASVASSLPTATDCAALAILFCGGDLA
jgi:hypothetical protein